MNLEMFFEEKEIPYKLWEIEYKGDIHFIDSNCVIEAIKQTQGFERKKIEGVLSVLDFKNASIIEYLHYLAEFLIQTRK